ncbi:MAG: phosphatidate cytidylyltransferase [Acidobacteriota bacterium]
MLQRILTGAALLPLLWVIGWAPFPVFLALAAVFAVICHREMGTMLGAAGLPVRLVSGLLANGLLLLPFVLERVEVLPALVLGALLIIGETSARAEQSALAHELTGSLTALLFPGLLLLSLVMLRAQDTEGLPGPGLLLFLHACVLVGDTAAYFTGRALGRTPLAPRISPKKTVEGLVGGLLFGTLVGAWVARTLLPAWADWGWALGLALACTAAGVLGDLMVSALKRSCGVKDTGALLPGHGGLLDRIDGLLLAGPVLWVALALGLVPAG